MRRAAALVLSVVGGVAWADSMAVTDNAVAHHGDWTIFVETDPRECFVASTPQRQSLVGAKGAPVATDRSPVLQVTIRPDEGTIGEVALFLGDESMTIDGQLSFTGKETMLSFFAQGAWAWPQDVNADMQALTIMSLAQSVEVRGGLTDGSQFADVYSTRGLTDALSDAARRCAG